MSMDSPMANRIRPGAVDTSSSLLAAGSCSAEEELSYSHNLLAAAPLCGEVAVLGRWFETLGAAEQAAVACFFAERCPQSKLAVVEQALRAPRMLADTVSIGHRHDFFEHFQRATGECRGTSIASPSGAPGELSQPSSAGPGGHAGRASASAGAGTGSGARPPSKSPFSTIQPFISTVNQVNQVGAMGSSDMYAAFSSSFPASTSSAAAAVNAPQARQFTPWSLRQELGRPQSAVVSSGSESAPAGAVGASSAGSGLNVSSSQPPFGSYQIQAPSTWSAPGNPSPMGLPLSDSRPWATSMRRHTHGDSSASPFRSLPRNSASAAAMGQTAASGSGAGPAGEPSSVVSAGATEFLPAAAPPVSGSAPGAGRSSAMPNTLTGQSSGLGAVSKLVGASARGAAHEQSASPPPHWTAAGSSSSSSAAAVPAAAPAKPAAKPAAKTSVKTPPGAAVGSGAPNVADAGRRAGVVAANAQPAAAKPALDATNPDLHKDVGSWLRSLRLHKYTENLAGLSWQEVVQLNEGELESRGVCAVGARRKMLKMFEQVREEHPEAV